MKITIICEGKTEKVFKEYLRDFVNRRLDEDSQRLGRPVPKPKLHHFACDGGLPSGEKLRRVVQNLLNTGSDAVIALTDVYPAFADANDAQTKLRAWGGPDPRFHAHVALHDFEAWLLPHWGRITEMAGRPAQPWGAPETVNHGNPPAHRLKALFEAGKRRDSYSKPRDARRILEKADLMLSIQACPELKSFINTILSLCGAREIS